MLRRRLAQALATGGPQRRGDVTSYAVMLVVLHLLTRRLFAVPFEWGRLSLAVGVVGGIAVAGELLLPTAGVDGFVLRTLALAAIPVALLATGIMHEEERTGLRGLVRRGRGAGR